jgi:hypothetical protein
MVKDNTNSEVATAKQEAKNLVVKTRADLEGPAAEALLAVSKQAKALEKERKEMKEPSLEAGRRVDALFKPTIAQLEDATKIIKQVMISAKSKFDKEDADKEAKIMARAEKTGKGSLHEETAINKVSEIDRVQKTNHTSAGSTTFKKVKQVTITDLEAIPVQYLRPKTAEEFKDFKPWPAIQKAAISLFELIEAGHNMEMIPGVKVELVDSLSAR